MFKPRTTKPEAGNPYYNRIANGGYSGAIKGHPVDAGCDVLANCVGYAAGRFNEIIGKNKFVYFHHPPNAEDFYDLAVSSGLSVGQTPMLGAIIVWAKGKTHTSGDGAGHVAVVESVNADGSIITSESGYGANKPFWTSKRIKGNGNWGESSAYRFLGFIYNPAVTSSGSRVMRLGDTGADVELMQARLHALGYLRKSEIDGDFGKITLGAVCAFQLQHGLVVDGVAGPATQAKLNG